MFSLESQISIIYTALVSLDRHHSILSSISCPSKVSMPTALRQYWGIVSCPWLVLAQLVFWWLWSTYKSSLSFPHAYFSNSGTFGYLLSILSILWCTYSASGIFVAVLRMSDQRLLIAYPIGLLYGCFALLSIFNGRSGDK